jgi:hypothetical protein
MMMRKCFACMCAGVCLCGGAIAVAEVHDFKRPNRLVCESRPFEVDLGAPERCEGEPAPHSRGAFVNTLAVASTTSSAGMGWWFAGWPVLSTADAEDAAEAPDGRFPHSTLPTAIAIPPGSNIVEHVPIYVVRGDDDPEQIG